MSSSSNLEINEQYEIPIQNNYSDFYPQNLFSLENSIIDKNPLLEGYHCLCKKCKRIPKFLFIKKDKIKLICKCKEPKNILINEIFNYLVCS